LVTMLVKIFEGDFRKGGSSKRKRLVGENPGGLRKIRGVDESKKKKTGGRKEKI